VYSGKFLSKDRTTVILSPHACQNFRSQVITLILLKTIIIANVHSKFIMYQLMTSTQIILSAFGYLLTDFITIMLLFKFDRHVSSYKCMKQKPYGTIVTSMFVSLQNVINLN